MKKETGERHQLCKLSLIRIKWTLHEYVTMCHRWESVLQKNYFQLVCGVYACVIAQPSYHWTFNLSNCDFGFQIHSFGACVRSVRFYCFLSSSIHCETTDEYIFVRSRYVSSEMKLFYALVSSGFKYFSALLRFTLYINANTIIKRGEKNVENKQLKLSLSHFYDGISANIFMMKLVFIVRFWAMLHTICFYRFSESEFYIRVSASSSNWNLMISYDLLVPFVKKTRRWIVWRSAVNLFFENHFVFRIKFPKTHNIS